MCEALSLTKSSRHLASDKASHIFKRLQNFKHHRALCSVACFHILDHAPTSFQLKIKEVFDIRTEQPSMNQQLHRFNLKLTFNSQIITFMYILLLLAYN